MTYDKVQVNLILIMQIVKVDTEWIWTVN